MGKKIAFENGRTSDFRGLLTLTLDRVTLHTVMHHSSTSTYTPNFIEIEESFCGRMDGPTYGGTDGHLGPALLGRLGGVNLKKQKVGSLSNCRSWAERAQSLPGPDPNIWLTVFEISSKSVHFRQSYSQTRKGRSLGP